jgi:hypothetical protein
MDSKLSEGSVRKTKVLNGKANYCYVVSVLHQNDESLKNKMLYLDAELSSVNVLTERASNWLH